MDHLLGNANDIGDLAHLCKGGRDGGCQTTRKLYDLRWLNVGLLHELDVREQLVRAAALEDAAVGHHHDALGKVGYDFHVVADHDDGAAALGHGAHGFHDGHALTVVKAARGLVEYYDLGLNHYD